MFEGVECDIFIVGVDGGVIEEDLFLLGAKENTQWLRLMMGGGEDDLTPLVGCSEDAI